MEAIALVLEITMFRPGHLCGLTLKSMLTLFISRTNDLIRLGSTENEGSNIFMIG